MKHNFYLLSILFFVGCKHEPTKIIEQTTDVYGKNIVLLDTRQALAFTSFHVQGSQSLNTTDFVILKNPLAKAANKKRVFDPDLTQTLRRLALKGISPEMTVYLIGDVKNSVENKKWRWLLSYLEIRDVRLFSLDEVRKMKNGRFTEAEKKSEWILKSSVEYQTEFIHKKAPNCFVGWSDQLCK